MIIFLGAGASRVFGIPTTLEFMDLFENEIGEGNKLYNDIKSNMNSKNFDLEVLMTILDDLSKEKGELLRIISPHTSAFLLRLSEEKRSTYIESKGLKAEIHELFCRLKEVIRRECLKAVRDKTDLILKVYDGLLGVFAKQFGGDYTSGDGRIRYHRNLMIFTTNYDTCVETYLNRRQIGFTQGVTPKYGYEVFDIGAYNDGAARVGVFKLHGSINLFIKDGEIRQLPAFPSEMTYLGEEYGDELMVYPIEASGGGYATRSPFLDLFHLFRERIKRDRWWVLIGSSFRDLTICSIMNDVLRLQREGEHPKIIFINPRAKEIKEKIKAAGFPSLSSLMNPIETGFGADETFEKLGELLTK